MYGRKRGGCKRGCMDGREADVDVSMWMHAWMDGWQMYGCIGGCMDGREVDVSVDVCMDVGVDTQSVGRK